MIDHIKKAVGILCEPDFVYELRCVKTEKGTISGCYDDFDQLAGDADCLTGGIAPAVYITLNPINPDLLARANNQFKYYSKHTTADDEIVKRCRLLIDCDPTRPAGISSSDVEHELAIQRCQMIREFLTANGFPRPLVGDSGNGGHLIYGIDLPNDSESDGLVQRFLESLDRRFSDEKVAVDKGVWNAARISKVYGTKTMKGDHTTNRPHRFSRIIESPNKLETVPVELLRRIAGMMPSNDQPKNNQTAEGTTSNKPNSTRVHYPKGSKSREDVERMMDAKGLEYRPAEPYQNGLRWVLDECPNSKEHTDGHGGASVFLREGIVGFDCKHRHCLKMTAKDVFGDDVNGAGSDLKEGKFDRLAKAFVEEQISNGSHPLHTSGKMYFYNQNRYVPCPELPSLLRDFFIRKGWSQSNNIVGNVTPIIQSHGWKDATKYGQMPFWAGDGKPFSDDKNVIAYQNGLLDITNVDGGLIPHSPNWCSTVCLPFAYDPNATCPIWDKFLNDVSGGDDKWKALLQEYFGYCLSSDTSLHKAMVMVGVPRSGKGTILRVMGHLVGESAGGFSLDKFGSEFGLSSLMNKSVALVGEIELSGSKDKAKILEVWKGIIGEDPQIINEKHNPEYHSVRLPTRFLCAANEVPRLMDASGALSHRLLFLPFVQSFVGREDHELEIKLQSELPGIANWALAGLMRLRANGGRFSQCRGHDDLHADFVRATSPVLAWIRAEMVVSKWANPGTLPKDCIVKETVTLEKQRAFELFSDWCENNDIQEKDKKWFGANLKSCLPKIEEFQPRINGVQTWSWKGIGIAEANNHEPGDDDHQGTSPSKKSGEQPEISPNAPNQAGEMASDTADTDENIVWRNFLNQKNIKEEETKVAKSNEIIRVSSVTPEIVPEPIPIVGVQPDSMTPPRRQLSPQQQALSLMFTFDGPDGKWFVMPRPSNLNKWKFGRLTKSGEIMIAYQGEGDRQWAIDQLNLKRGSHPLGYNSPIPSEPSPVRFKDEIPEDEFFRELEDALVPLA